MNRWQPRQAFLATLTLVVACGIDDPLDPDDLEPRAPVATLLGAVSGNDQTGGAGQELPAPLVIRVVDQFGDPAAGVEVVWSVVTGGGSVAPVSTTTDEEGRASTEWTLGGTPGEQTMQATTTPATTTATFRATATAGTPASIQVTPDTLRFDALGDTARIAVTAQDQFGNEIAEPEVSWSSAQPERASVNAAGLVTATGNGTTRVVASFDDDAADTVVVIVAQAPAQLELQPAADTLIGAGDSVALRARVFDANGRAITAATVAWSSSDSSVATVSSSGVVTAVDSGSALIVAASDSVSDTTTITVLIPAAVEVTPAADTLAAVRDTLRLRATVTEADGDTIEGARVRWVSLDTLIARVDPYGRVTARDTGSARIVASVGSLADTATVEVAPPPPPAPRRLEGRAAARPAVGLPAPARPVSGARRSGDGRRDARRTRPR